MYATPIYRSLLANALFPAHPDDVTIKFPGHEPDPWRDYAWTAAICAQHCSSLNRFVELREQFERLAMTGLNAEAHEVLERVRAELGFSLWYIENKLQLIQASQGLKAQKDYLSEIIETKNIDPTIAYLIYLFSIKSEPHISVEYLDDIIYAINGAGISEVRAAFFVYFIHPLRMHEMDAPFHCVHSCDSLPLIDRYMSLMRCMQIDYSKLDTDRQSSIEAALVLLAGISDDQLETLRFLGSCAPEGRSTTLAIDPITLACDAYTEGRYLDAIELSKSDVSSRPSSSPLCELLVRSCRLGDQPLSPVAPPSSLLSQALTDIDNIISMNSDYRGSFVRLERIALSLPNTPFSIAIFAIKERRHHFEPDCSFSSLDLLWAIICSPANPWHYYILKAIKPGIEQHIQEAVGASPAFTLRVAFDQLDEIATAAAIRRLNAPQERIESYLGQNAMRARNLTAAIAHFSHPAHSSSSLAEISANSKLFKALLLDGNFERCIDLACSSYYANDNYISAFDLSTLIHTAIANQPDIRSSIKFNNVVSFVAITSPNKFEGTLSDCFEDTLDAYGVRVPSELVALGGHDQLDLIHFVAKVASVRTMEDCTNFADLDEIEAERIRLCIWLTNADPANAAIYSGEIRQITRDRQMSSLHAKINSSKIYVDEAGIKSSMSSQLEDGHSRYVELLGTPDLSYRVEQITRRIGRLLDTIDNSGADKAASDMKRLRLPSTERLGVLEEIYTAFLSRFLFSPEFGLDTHLSANIRHGTFVGQARRSVAEEHLVTVRDSASSNYEENAYWISRYDALGEISSIIDEKLRRFSLRLDGLLHYVNDELMHIRGERRPHGLFRFSDTTDAVNNIAAQVSQSTTLEEFEAALIDAAWQQTNASMSTIRAYLLEDFSRDANKYFDLLVSDLESAISRERIVDLLDAIARARTDFHHNIQEISHWFRPPGRIDNHPYPFDIVAEVAEREVTSCYGDRNFAFRKDISAQRNVSGRKIFGFIEILFILLQNAIIHSGQQARILIEMAIIESDGYLEISVSNTLGLGVDANELRNNAQTAVARYSQSAIELVRQEGGSGLSKIWRTAEHTLKVPHTADMTVVDDRTFKTTLLLQSDGLFA
ncbi:hypothetical protein [Kaistia defluvii]